MDLLSAQLRADDPAYNTAFRELGLELQSHSGKLMTNEVQHSNHPWFNLLLFQVPVSVIFFLSICYSIYTGLSHSKRRSAVEYLWFGLLIQTALLTTLAIETGQHASSSVQRHNLGASAAATFTSLMIYSTFYFDTTSTRRGLYHLFAAIIWSFFKFDLIGSIYTLDNFIVILFWCAFTLDFSVPFKQRSFEIPFSRISFFQLLSFSWLENMIALAGKTALGTDNLWEVDEKSSVQTARQDLLRTSLRDGWSGHSLLSFVATGFTGPLVQSGMLELVAVSGKLFQPWLLREFLRSPNMRIVGYMFCLRVITAFSDAHRLFLVKLIAVKIKSAFSALVCEQVLSVSTTESKSTTPSNLTEVDTHRIIEMMPLIHNIWSYPLQCCISVGCIMYFLGWKAIILPCMIASLAYPLVHMVNKQMFSGMGRLMITKDQRIKLTEDVLDQIKPIHLLSWQDYFREKIEQARMKELSILGSLAGYQASLFGILGAVPELMTAVAFFSVFLTSGHLDAQSIFPTLGYWVILKTALPSTSAVLTQLNACIVSFQRIQSYLVETKGDTLGITHCNDMHASPSLCVRSASFALFGGNRLVDINLYLRSPSFVTISGRSGCGKTALCRSLMGFVKPIHGTVTTSGHTAYVPQVPWLIRGTIRENILFGKRFEPQLYAMVLKWCALDIDIARFPEKDNKRIGDVGVTLSGGQMARVSIARALYSKADIYFFDDPLAALDVKTKIHLIRHVFGPGGILSQAICVVVTHHPDLIRVASHNYTIDNSRLLDIRRLINLSGAVPIARNDDFVPEAGAASEESECIGDNLHTAMPLLSNNDTEDISSMTAQVPTKAQFQSVKSNWPAYKAWLGMAHPLSWVAVFGMIAIGKVTSGYSTYLLKLLAQDSDSAALYDLVWFAAVGWVQALCSVAFLLTTYHLCLIPAATKVHAALTRAVLHKPISFFDTISVGEVLNLFTNDLSKLDGTLTSNLLGMLMIGSNLLLVLIILLLPSLVALVYLVPLAVVYFALQTKYLRAACQLRRLDLQTRIPVIDSIQAAQTGYESVLLFGQRTKFLERHFGIINDNIRMMLLAGSVEVWLLLRLDILGSLVQVFSALSLLWMKLDPAKLGFIMNYSMQVTVMLQAMVRYRTNLDLDIISVQRIQEAWAEDIDRKVDSSSSKALLIRSWPSQGAISFKRFSASYAGSQAYCLKEVTFDILPSQKVAIVGRSGSGKSSLVLALMGLIQRMAGKIEIDGIDMSLIEPSVYSSIFSVVPQDSPILSGTVRENLDPFGNFEESQLRDVANSTGLSSALQTNGDVLDYMIHDRGNNLSRGQFQILAIARAMLKKSSILILDEATAALSTEIDRTVNDLILSKLNTSTVLAVVHRLDRIHEYDRVLVLDNGSVIEYDTPNVLAQQPHSVLSQLLEAT